MLRFLFCLNLGSDPNRFLIDYFFLNIHTSDTTNNYTNTVIENELMLSLALYFLLHPHSPVTDLYLPVAMSFTVFYHCR